MGVLSPSQEMPSVCWFHLPLRFSSSSVVGGGSIVSRATPSCRERPREGEREYNFFCNFQTILNFNLCVTRCKYCCNDCSI